MVADVIVIGGGPAGATISRILAENDVDVLLFEKRKVIGVPVRITTSLRNAPFIS
jgi:flavin-dependent dehydrogenase